MSQSDSNYQSSSVASDHSWWNAVRGFQSQLDKVLKRQAKGISSAYAASVLVPYWKANKVTAVQDALNSEEFRVPAATAAIIARGGVRGRQEAERLAAKWREAENRAVAKITAAIRDQTVLNTGEGAGHGYYRRTSPRSYSRTSPRSYREY